MTPAEKYQDLLKQAAELERMAKQDASHGGPTYWRNREESTRQAIAHDNWQPPPEDKERIDSMIWALPLESCRAIHWAFRMEHLEAIWLSAAAQLRSRAADMRGELQKQADQVAQTLAELKAPDETR